MPEGRRVGRIKAFNADKGWGFIQTGQIEISRGGDHDFRPDGERDVFLHVSAFADGGADLPAVSRFVSFDVVEVPKGLEACNAATLSPMWRWLPPQAITFAPHQLATGARECLLRRDAGCPTWTEWLPDLALEVIHKGHYGELPLLELRTVDPLFGLSVTREIPETLTLPHGRNRYTLPLILDRQSRRPLALEARLESGAFPLAQDLPVRLRLDYRYGVDRSYTLTVVPIEVAEAPFERLTARWVSPGDHDSALSRSPRDALLEVDILSSDWMAVAKVIGAIANLGDDEYDYSLFRVTARCWSQGRSLAEAPPEVQAAFPAFRDRLIEAALQPGEGAPDIPRALEILACLHQDAPAEVIERILQLEQAADADGKAYGDVARLLGLVVGDGAAGRAEVLTRLLARLERHSSPDGFNPGLVRHTMAALSGAVWRHPGLIATLAARPRAPALLIGQCRRSLTNLLVRVPERIAEDERERIGKLYARPYCNTCELLLALLRSSVDHPDIRRLRFSSPQGSVLARSIRQLDARFTAARIKLRWSIVSAVSVPDALRRMSPVAWALSRYLASSNGVDLIQLDEG
ncbi:MAG: cold shock domain-containing protein [Opitutae bacterium]|nr:cold shock domain-containing protein [Opitutae bacterium]